MTINKLIRGNLSFRREYVAGAGDFLDRLASEGQSPSALFVGCSDSRVVPELLTSSSPGDLFVVRNVANIVPPADETRSLGDDSVGAAIEYALAVLGVQHIVVCGHYGCGGVRAVLEDHIPPNSPNLADWLCHAKPPAARATAAGHSGEALLDRSVEENVEEQIANLATYPLVRAQLDAGKLHLHGWVYNLRSGRLLVWNSFDDRWAEADELREAGAPTG